MSNQSPLHAAAVAYADALVRYHEIYNHVDEAGGPEKCLRQDANELRSARDAMYGAQNTLDTLAARVALHNAL